MFCTNCGKELPDDAKFCNRCGTPREDEFVSASQPTQQPYMQQPYMQQPATKPQQRPGLKVGGIILLVCGVLSLVGGFTNGSFKNMMEYGFDLANLVTILVQFGLVFGGIRMIAKSKGSQ